MRFSVQQKRAITWWRTSGKQAVICDGAVRSGKTLAVGLGFFLWATATFRGRQLAVCGKTVGAARRNLLSQVGPALRQMGFVWEEKVSRGTVEVGLPGRTNTFFLFGGRDESSAALIQGMTLAGALLDEVALMPRSFVEQTCARCSVEGARLWFSCNPDTPEHWFYKQWIEKREARGAEYLRFTMEDNPSLSEKVKQRYRDTFQGTFYRRFVLGEWVADPDFLAQGGRCRRVVTMNTKSTVGAMRYSARFQMEKARAGRRTLTVSAPRPFLAWPGELVRMDRAGWSGLWRVLETVVEQNSGGGTTKLKLGEPAAVI